MNTKLEGVITHKNGEELIAVVYRNKEGHQIFYTATEMNSDDIIKLLQGNERENS